MVSSWTTQRHIEKPANGDDVGNWNVPVNADWDIIDACLGGLTTLNATAASGVVTLTVAQYRSPIIEITGTLTAAVNYQLPSGIGGLWSIFNNTTGAFTITYSNAAAGSTVTLAQGYSSIVVSDGTNIGFGSTLPVSAAGSNTQIQYNNSGVFAGSSNLTWNGSMLQVGGAFSASGNVTGAVGTFSSLSISGNISGATAGFSGNVTVGGTLGITGTLTGALGAFSSLTVSGTSAFSTNPTYASHPMCSVVSGQAGYAGGIGYGSSAVSGTLAVGEIYFQTV